MEAPSRSPYESNILTRTWDRVLTAFAYLMAAVLAAAMLAIVFEVIARYFFNSPTVWAVDFSEYAMVYLTFFGAAWLLRKRSHIKVDMLVTLLSSRQQLFLEIVVSIIAAVLMAIFLWKGTELTLEAYVQNQAVLKSWLVPRWITLLPIPSGALLMLVEFLRQTWVGIQDFRDGRFARHAHAAPEAGLAEPAEQRGL